jgi:hypothetical protein
MFSTLERFIDFTFSVPLVYAACCHRVSSMGAMVADVETLTALSILLYFMNANVIHCIGKCNAFNICANCYIIAPPTY